MKYDTHRKMMQVLVGSLFLVGILVAAIGIQQVCRFDETIAHCCTGPTHPSGLIERGIQHNLMLPTCLGAADAINQRFRRAIKRELFMCVRSSC